MKKLILISILFVIGCGYFPLRKPAPQVPAKPSALELYSAGVERLKQFTVNGMIVSLRNGKPEHMGESILWTGVALSSLTCKDGEHFENRFIAIINMILNENT